jgi:hypothetical protein
MSSEWTIDGFLSLTGWPDPGSTRKARMASALRFWSSHSRHQAAQPAYFGDIPAHCFAFQIRSVTTRLCAWMQAINFDHPVEPMLLGATRQLKCFRYPPITPSRAPSGNWYTDPDVPASALALPPGQCAAQAIVVAKPVMALRSRAGDVIVDWSMRKATDAYWYRKGGGVQYFVADPRYLTSN